MSAPDTPDDATPKPDSAGPLPPQDRAAPEQRTVIRAPFPVDPAPSGVSPDDGWAPPEATPPAPVEPLPPAHPATVFQPAARIYREENDAGQAVAPEPGTAGWGGEPGGQDPPATPGRTEPPVARASSRSGRIEPGARLNNTYEVRAFLAAGGMGEVYKGANIITDEQVAIKVMLPHLAHDETVVALFQKEARTLINLKHPAVVQYRTVAEDLQHDILYIVTEFIPGPNLGDMLGQIEPTQERILLLTRRLCEGLEHAHAGGAVHRDMSPDNVLLRDGRLEEATIIDFGIAKSLDASVKTSIGDAFAGKLSYAAPEQLGDFSRQIGPWTDVYSTALVILAFANKRPVYMGGSPVEAIDIRRKGINVSFLPPALQPVFTRMLAPDPQKRYQSMGDVLRALDGLGGAGSGRDRGTASKASPLAALPETLFGMPRMAVLGVGGGLAALVVGLIAVTVLPSLGSAPAVEAPSAPVQASPAGAAAPAAPAIPASEQVRQRVVTAARAVSCSWLDIESTSAGADGVAVRVVGVAGDPAAANAALSSASETGGGTRVVTDTSGVVPIERSLCAAIDALRAVRSEAAFGERAIRPQRDTFTILSDQSNECDPNNARVMIDITIPDGDFAMITVGGGGIGQTLVAARSEFVAMAEANPKGFVRNSPNSYTFNLCTSEEGVSGLFIASGSGPFSTGLPSISSENSPEVRLDEAWAADFARSAAAQGWRVDGAWFDVVRQ